METDGKFVLMWSTDDVLPSEIKFKEGCRGVEVEVVSLEQKMSPELSRQLQYDIFRGRYDSLTFRDGDDSVSSTEAVIDFNGELVDIDDDWDDNVLWD